MRARARNEEGFALVSTVILIVVLLGLGFALLSYTDSQQHAAVYENSGEQAYALAEAALNAQIAELSSAWPTQAHQWSGYPGYCNASNGASTTGCPSPSDLTAAYPSTGGTCPSNTPKDPWSSSSTTSNGWTTYVRGDGAASQSVASSTSTAQYFNSTVEGSPQEPFYDTGDRAVWLRAVGVVNCRIETIVTKVTAQFTNIPLPQAAISANGFATSNQGNKIIIDTIGTYAQPSSEVVNPSNTQGPIAMRCSGLSSSTCKQYRNTPSPGQVYPDTTNATPNPSNTLTASQANELMLAAQANGTYFGVDGSGNPICPTTMAQLTGAPVYVLGPCAINIKSTAIANSSSSPGVLVINNGSLTLDGGATFFGVIYAMNAQGAGGTPCGNGNNATDVVHILGSSEVQGAIIVDGNGTVCFGSSGGNNGTVTNFVYDDRGFFNVIGYGGAAATPNSFRVLPLGQ
jgi:Tfp pilus assembly protein PilX